MGSILSLQTHLPLVILNTLLARYFKIIQSYSSINEFCKGNFEKSDNNGT